MRIPIVMVEKVNSLLDMGKASIDSWIRTDSRNGIVGGAAHSQHLSGNAVDLIYDSRMELIEASKKAIMVGFTGIEVDFRNMHLHVDLREGVRWWVVINLKGETMPLETFLNQTGLQT